LAVDWRFGFDTSFGNPDALTRSRRKIELGQLDIAKSEGPEAACELGFKDGDAFAAFR
jgi:hypothetical protein